MEESWPKLACDKKESQEKVELRRLRKEGIKKLRKENWESKVKEKRWLKEENENKVVKARINHKEGQGSKAG